MASLLPFLVDRFDSVYFITYRRERQLPHPGALTFTRHFGTPTAIIRYAAPLCHKYMTGLMHEAMVRLLGTEPTEVDVAYHQSATLVPSTPDGPICIATNHAPFVEHVIHHMGPTLAEAAFGNDAEKLRVLAGLQAASVRWVKKRSGAHFLELSALQYRELGRRGVNSRQCSMAPPPVCVADSGGDLSSAQASWLATGTERALMFTAAARVDAFKNLEAVVDSYVDLMQRGQPTSLYVAAGSDRDERSRELLHARIPKPFRRYCWFEPRMPPDILGTFFRAAAARAVFAFPSRFETLGLTVLQAIQFGVRVALPDDVHRVGAVEIVPTAFRYSPSTVAGLSDKIQELWASRHLDQLLSNGYRLMVSTPGEFTALLDDRVAGLRRRTA